MILQFLHPSTFIPTSTVIRDESMCDALFFGKARFVRHECMIHVLSHAKINMQVLKIQNEKKQMRCSLTHSHRAVGRFENL